MSSPKRCPADWAVLYRRAELACDQIVASIRQRYAEWIHR